MKKLPPFCFERQSCYQLYDHQRIFAVVLRLSVVIHLFAVLYMLRSHQHELDIIIPQIVCQIEPVVACGFECPPPCRVRFELYRKLIINQLGQGLLLSVH